MTCEICDFFRKAKDLLLYEDDSCGVFLWPKPAANGHMVLIPKNHYTIIEQIPDKEIGHFFEVINKVSTIIFDNLNIAGTNILVQNGIAAGQTASHVMINLIPRNENDGINLTWETIKLSEQEMNSTADMLQNLNSEHEVPEHKSPDQGDDGPKSQDNEDSYESEDEKDIFIEHINRIP